MLPEVETEPGDGAGGEGHRFLPPTADASLIFLHGRGDTGDSFIHLASIMDERDALRGRVRLILPTADKRMVTKYGTRMNAWFDVRSDRRDVDEDTEGFEQSRVRIEELIRDEIEWGISPKRIILAGFSQGGAMTYLTALRSKFRIGGAVCMSGWCPMLHDLQVSEAFLSSGSPFLHQHGLQDGLVSYQYALQSFEQAESAVQRASENWDSPEGRFEFRTYANLAHTIHKAEMDEFMDFIEDCLAKTKGGLRAVDGVCKIHA